MTNFEYYKEQIQAVGYEFGLTENNKIVGCEYRICERCKFRGYSCVSCRIEWLYSEYKEQPKLTKEKGTYCPIMTGGGNQYVARCIKEDCAWWCEWTGIDESCAIPLLAGMFADSTVCRTVFAEVE